MHFDEVCDWCGSDIVVGESYLRHGRTYWHDGCGERLREFLGDAEYGTVQASESVAPTADDDPPASDERVAPAES